MSTTDKLFSGSIPEIYDRAMVPLIFEPYARDLAERVSKLGPQSVLEVAAGTGVVTRALAAKLPAQARIVVTDLNQPMLDHARTRMVDDPRITWQQADAQALPFEDAQFDAVVCQFGAMFFPDRVGAYGQVRRVVRLGGHFLFNVWGAIEENEFADEVTRALGHFFPADPPRFMARTPHGYHDADVIRADLHAAGFRNITIEPLDAVSAASSPYEAATAYCQGTPLRAEIEARGGSLEEVTRYVANALGKRFGEGPVSGRIRALVVDAA
ncbi:methyltransferase domain-containing protein [Mesorhizobium ciceri]|uniref:class I SAM-dependent methyltransferase n=1 Tax=Mesorhizobium TaxID=68287 RepID=UPI0004898A37|nr:MULTISPECIES: class I SAM-dependent methyltransferase [Mesorhizobium]AMY03865.1 SAM-dependent methyltransferase [Mesorhizobium ciceri biovar biserrulae]